MISLNDISTVLDRIAADTHTPADLETLHSLLLVSGDHHVVQVGKYNINIGHGENIQIGDRIYQGPDAESIRQIICEVLKSYNLPSPAAPFQAPSLPLHFVPRPEVSNAIKARLLAREDTPGILVVSAIHGLGGIGKSVLATALAHDPAVQESFPDGVLWAVLGQEPDLLSLLSGWIQALGDYDFHTISVEAASIHLRTLLHDKAILLVVDDVWDPAHVVPFQIGGPRCQVLITTRRADVADDIGANLYPLDPMTEAQSLHLLSARLGRPLVEEERAEATGLARALGYLPLALELAAVRIVRGVEWSDLREALEQEVARLEALEGPRARKRGLRLIATFNLSLNALRDEEDGVWQAFAWLGVLPDDAVVSAPMVATLWEIDQIEASETLELLWNDALLLSGPPIRIGELTWSTYRLHDLLHDMARRLLTTDQPHGLGRIVSEAHSAMLKRYQAQTRNGLWHTLPYDGYIHAHLTWHFSQAGWEAQLHTLLCEETAENRNGWFEARDRLGQTAGYLEDVTRAWQQAEITGDTALQVRYALCLSSLTSLGVNMPAALLAWGTRHGLLSAEQALYVARGKPEVLPVLASVLRSQRPDLLKELLVAVGELRESGYLGGKDKALASIVPYLPAELLEEAFEIAKKVKDEKLRTQALVGVAPCLPEQLREEALREALAAARKIDWIESRARALGAVVPLLSGSMRNRVTQEMFESAKKIDSEFRRELTMRELRVQIAGESKRAKHEEQQPPNESDIDLGQAWRARTGRSASEVPDLAPFLSKGLLKEALKVAGELHNDHAQALALTVLAPRLPEKLLEEALSAACRLGERGRFGCPKAEALTGLAPHLPSRLLKDALTATCAIKQEIGRAEALAGLAPYLSEELLEEALESARETGYERARETALTGLVPHLPKKLLEQALVAMREIGDKRWRARAMVELAPHLPEELLEEVLAVAPDVGDEEQYVDTLIRLIQHLPESLQRRALKEAVTATRRIEDAYNRQRGLTRLASHLPEELMDETLTVAREISDEKQRAWVLSELVPYLPARLSEEVFTIALEIDDEEQRARVLISLSPCLPNVAEEALKTTRAIKDGWPRAKALARLAPYLPEELMKQARMAVDEIKDKRWCAEARAGLAPYVPEPLRGQMLSEALTAVVEIEDEWLRAVAVIDVAPHLSEQLLEKALAAVQGFKHKAKALIGLAPYLSERLLEEAVTIAQGISDTRSRAEALVGLVPYMPEALRKWALGKVLTAVRKTGYEPARAEMLVQLLPYLSKSLRQRVLNEALAAMEKTGFESGRPSKSVWAALVPLLPEPFVKKALVALREDGDKYDYDSALAVLASHLPEHLSDYLITEVLSAVHEIKWESQRAEALAGLALRLPEHLLEKALAAAQEIEDKDEKWDLEHGRGEYISNRARALAGLSLRWASLSHESATRVWLDKRDGANLLHRLARRRRRYFLSDLCALTPVITLLGGKEAIKEIFHAIQDVGRWWP